MNDIQNIVNEILALKKKNTIQAKVNVKDFNKVLSIATDFLNVQIDINNQPTRSKTTGLR